VGVFLQVTAPLRSRYRDDILALAQHPSKRELGRRNALLAGDPAYRVDESEITVEVLALETRDSAAEVVFLEVVELGRLLGYQPT
jgi:hypothetical protein